MGRFAAREERGKKGKGKDTEGDAKGEERGKKMGKKREGTAP